MKKPCLHFGWKKRRRKEEVPQVVKETCPHFSKKESRTSKSLVHISVRKRQSRTSKSDVHISVRKRLTGQWHGRRTKYRMIVAEVTRLVIEA